METKLQNRPHFLTTAMQSVAVAPFPLTAPVSSYPTRQLAQLEYNPPPFRAHRLLIGGHLQTIATMFLGLPKHSYTAQQRLIPLADGDQLVLHDDKPPTWKTGDPVVILIHGLGGNHRSSYVVRTAYKLNTVGVRTFALDLRGCGAGFLLAKQAIHAGRSEDAAATLLAVQELCPGSPIIMVGYSMSGNIVLKMAGEWGQNIPRALDSLIAVSPPVDLETCSRSLRTGFNRLYDRFYLQRCLDAVAKKNQQICAKTYRLHGPHPLTLREFDDRYTAPLAGFRDSAHYYQEVSSVPWVPHIHVPTVIISADDDPIIPRESLENLQRPPHVALHITRSGGHLGFFGRSGVDPDRQWLDWRILDWACQRFGISPKE